MTRRPRRETLSRLLHITARGNNRQSIFADEYDYERFYGILDRGIAQQDVRCHADVLMGNHFHLLLDGAIAEISALMWFVNFHYSISYNARHQRINHMLGRRFHSSEIPDDRGARAVAVYIALNPVRAGLCVNADAWEPGSYTSHAGFTEPRSHLSTTFTRDLFTRVGTTLAMASEVALMKERGGRPRLADLLPDIDRLTATHVRHAREVFGYTAVEVANHYRTSPRTLRRQLAGGFSRMHENRR